MYIWTKKNEYANWTRQAGVVQALEMCLDNPSTELRLLVDKPDADVAQLTAAIRLAKKVGLGMEQIIITAEHFSSPWIERLQELGVEYVVLCEPSSVVCGSREGERVKTSEVCANLCRHLHTKTAKNVTIWVCGARKDRVVLSPSQVRSWCRCRASGCPHIVRVVEDAS